MKALAFISLGIIWSISTVGIVIYLDANFLVRLGIAGLLFVIGNVIGIYLSDKAREANYD